MTARTYKAYGVLSDTTKYDTGHSDTFKNWGDAATFANAGTSNNPVIELAMMTAAQKINLETIGVVQPRDLIFLCNPVAARKLSLSAEIHDYVKQPAGIQIVKGDELSMRQNWGLPPQLYGIDVVVDDAVRVSTKKGATLASGYILGDNEAYLLARPGGLVGAYGSASFSAISIFSYEEMTVETKDDPDNRKVKGRVVENYDVNMTSPAAIIKMTNLFS